LTQNRFLISLLTPLSWLYGLATGLRNLLYDKSIISSYKPTVPVVVVGNLVAGGTGKTPVVAWLAGRLSEKYRVAILSRGYGRTTRGFMLLGPDSAPATVGDEPMELRMMLPGIAIAVDSNRKRGILALAADSRLKPDVILMDDGFQHRRVTPGFAILLDSADRPMRRERLLPAGLRREPLAGVKRAHLIIETNRNNSDTAVTEGGPVLLVTGTASPDGLAEGLKLAGRLMGHLRYPDHFRYTEREAQQIKKAFQNTKEKLAGETAAAEPVILTTGKDFVKLRLLKTLGDLPMEVIPNRPPLTREQQEEILTQVNRYVEKTHGIN
jgi:tetraacyldisaccharide 4'-kinase